MSPSAAMRYDVFGLHDIDEAVTESLYLGSLEA